MILAFLQSFVLNFVGSCGAVACAILTFTRHPGKMMSPWRNAMEILSTWQIENIDLENSKLVLALFGGVGLLYCCFGYRLFKLILGLTGFLLAGAVAGGLAGWLSHGHNIITVVALVIGGICGAMALFFLYRLGVFCVGGLATLLLVHALLQGRPEPWVPWVIMGVPLVGGGIALLLERPVMTLATAAIGASLVTYAGANAVLLTEWGSTFSAKLTESQVTWTVFGTWAGLTILGALSQYGQGRRDHSKEEQ
jgi:hypothetical protein